MTIICGTDFSQQAVLAVDVAAAIASSTGDELKVVYAFDKRSSEQILASAAEVVLATIRQRLRSEVERIRKTAPSVESEILTGAPDEALVELAETSKAAMVVISAVGSRSASFWTLGSVAERTAATAPCPVLVVRSSDPFLQWTRGDRPLRVVVGIDSSAASDAAVCWLRELRRIGQCEVTFVHIYSPIDEGRRLGLPFSPIPGENREVEAALGRELRVRLSRCGVDRPQLILQMNLGRAADPLVQIANAEGADLLVVGSNRRGTLERATHGSVSYTALHVARMSVASIPVGFMDRLETVSKPVVEHVLVAMDSTHGEATVRYAAAVAPPQATIHVVAAGAAGSERELRERVSDLLEGSLGERSLQVEVVSGDDFAEAVHHAAERSNADMICASAAEASKLLRLTSRAVLVVRA